MTDRPRCDHGRWQDACAICKDRSAEPASKPMRVGRTAAHPDWKPRPGTPTEVRIAGVGGDTGRKKFHIEQCPQALNRTGQSHWGEWVVVSRDEMVEALASRPFKFCKVCTPQDYI